jgi:plastocyanin
VSSRHIASVALGLVIVLAGCAPTSQPGAAAPAKATPAPAASPNPSPSPSPSPGAGGGPAVEIQGFTFDPPELTVPAGTTVTWTNSDFTQHTVTADDRSYDSGLLSMGATFSHTYTAPGTYGYFCIPHGAPGSGQFGRIVVQ